jgi:hypothetical protein
VMVSMWVGIEANLLIAGGLYLLLAAPMRALYAGGSTTPRSR